MWCVVVGVVGTGKPALGPAGISVHHRQGFRADSLDWWWAAPPGLNLRLCRPFGISWIYPKCVLNLEIKCKYFPQTLGGSDGKESAYNMGGLGFIPRSRRSPGEGKGMATHSSILAWRIPIDRGAWRATAHGAAKSWT